MQPPFMLQINVPSLFGLQSHLVEADAWTTARPGPLMWHQAPQKLESGAELIATLMAMDRANVRLAIATRS